MPRLGSAFRRINSSGSVSTGSSGFSKFFSSLCTAPRHTSDKEEGEAPPAAVDKGRPSNGSTGVTVIVGADRAVGSSNGGASAGKSGMFESGSDAGSFELSGKLRDPARESHISGRDSHVSRSTSATWLAEGTAPTPPASSLPDGLDTRNWALSDFKMLKTVGVGFMGSVRVVKLVDGSQTRPFALKVMDKRRVIQKKQVVHVMQERQLLGQVDHPFIVNLIAAFQDEARVYMLMEFVNGGELFSAVRHGKRFQNDAAKFFAAEITLALGHLHGMEIAYRDLKLENILVDARGHTKITDFGFAKKVPARTWTRCGTSEYMAPEIISMSGHGMCVDWWALGILIYEMLTGRTPFRGGSSKEVYERVLKNEPTYPSHFTGNAKGIVSRLLAKDRMRRLGSGATGTNDVQAHPWFRMLDWNKVLHKEYAPPFLPSVRDESDTCMFSSYPEEELDPDSATGLTAAQQLLFKSF